MTFHVSRRPKPSEDTTYPITCGPNKAELVWKKFICPGINAKCVKVQIRYFLVFNTSSPRRIRSTIKLAMIRKFASRHCAKPSRSMTSFFPVRRLLVTHLRAVGRQTMLVWSSALCVMFVAVGFFGQFLKFVVVWDFLTAGRKAITHDPLGEISSISLRSCLFPMFHDENLENRWLLLFLIIQKYDSFYFLTEIPQVYRCCATTLF